MDEKMRAEFEAAYTAGDVYMVERTSSIQFECIYKQRAWAAWQASRAALVIELPERITRESGYSEDDEYYNLALDHCRSQIESAGVRVKP